MADRTELQALYDRAVEEKRRADERPARFEKLVVAKLNELRRSLPDGAVTKEKNGFYVVHCPCSSRILVQPGKYRNAPYFVRDHNSCCGFCREVARRIWFCYHEVRE